MAGYRFSRLFSIASFILAPLILAGHALIRAVSVAWDFAFPAAAVVEASAIVPLQSEAVTYGVARARTRSFLERVAVRSDDLGLKLAA